ncbi:modification methylase VspI family protein [Candidatus Omnitrophus magneticus]|uniref:site-specific DNA-methyltransferase (adenine-specific) n=1 Tax=Candidatus Omnitrophus magneticus TaxID=1609969 RepID=A0A0F0CNT9_9BACT|nr:modification methylase VspI family protein [Candidatus Omnitrophus magneticus]
MNRVFTQKNEVMDINQTADFLGISSATARNWLRHNYLIPISPDGKINFLVKDVIILKENLMNGNVARLRKRANKDKSSKTFLPVEYLSDIQKAIDVDNAVKLIFEYGVSAEEGLFFLALNYLSREGLIAGFEKLDDIFDDEKKVFRHRQIMREIKDWAGKIYFKSGADFQSKILDCHIPNVQDFLGVVYQTLSLVGDKSKTGAYYTPATIVKTIADDYIKSFNCKILDPSCGTGQFLLTSLDRLIALGGERGALENIWGLDIDDISVRIARINLLLKCKTRDDIAPNIFRQNTLLDNTYDLFSSEVRIKEQFFDLVITNPPWGAKFSHTELSQLNLLFPGIQSGESFSYFIEKGIRYLKDDGILSYILPESFLNVKIHADIRKCILSDTTILKIVSLNRAFKNVFTPAVRLDLKKSELQSENLIDIKNSGDFKARQKDFAKNSNYEFSININAEDKLVFDKIFSKKYYTFAGYAEWALGIVTGDNDKYLSGEKLSGYEAVLTGKEVSKFVYQTPKQFIKYEPEKFQQSAPIAKYRAKEKLIYRFISKELVFSYDDKKILTLNSANILIPSMDKYPVKFILGLFNSSLYQYIFQKKFSSIKVLRSHIEELPLPDWSEKEIRVLSELTENIMDARGNETEYKRLFREIDYFVMSQWGLTKEEMDLVARSIGSTAD